MSPFRIIRNCRQFEKGKIGKKRKNMIESL